MRKVFSLFLSLCLFLSLSAGAALAQEKKALTFVIVPKVVHAWFDEVNKGAQMQAKVLSQQLGVEVKIDYRAPQSADVAEQNAVLEQAAATRPTGIALDPLDYAGNKAVIEEIQKRGIPRVSFCNIYVIQQDAQHSMLTSVRFPS